MHRVRVDISLLESLPNLARRAARVVVMWLTLTLLFTQTAWSIEPDIPRLVVQTGHSGFVTSLTFAPDGRTLVSGSEDKTVKLWDVATGRELRTLGGRRSEVLCVAYAPDGKTIASGSRDETVKLWEAANCM